MRVLVAYTALFLALAAQATHLSTMPHKKTFHKPKQLKHRDVDPALHLLVRRQAAAVGAAVALAPVVLGGITIAAKGTTRFVKRLQVNKKEQAAKKKAAKHASDSKGENVHGNVGHTAEDKGEAVSKSFSKGSNAFQGRRARARHDWHAKGLAA